MTYPPQQPGPGGWEQQPGNVPGPPQQQPAWYGNQQAGWGQQGGQQPPPPPPPDWGGAQFGNPTWTHEPGGFTDVTSPKNSKTPLIVTVVVLAVLVLGGAGTGVFLLLNSGPGDPAKVAQDVANKVNQRDFADVRGDLCQANLATLQAQFNALQRQYPKIDVRVGKVSTASNTQASAEVLGTVTDVKGYTQSVDQQMALVVENGGWKVCQLGQ